MLSKKSKKNNRVVIGLSIVLAILLGNIVVKASTYGIQVFKLNPLDIIYFTVKSGSQQTQQSKGKILIYSTHTNEHNIDSNITQVAEDLSQKLRNKGFEVEHNTTDFVGINDYNNAYANSRKMLMTKSLNDYALVLDIHMDSTPSPVTTNVNDKTVAKLMIPTTSENPYLKPETKIINGIKDKMKEFSNAVFREETTHYKTGIANYNLSMSPNMLLIEIGSDKSTLLECKLSNTYLSASINNYLRNNK